MNKLELTWIGKDVRPRLEPRILLEDPERSYHAANRIGEADQFDNRLIFGDNLLALKALEQEFAGKVKCILIDPPYNTGSAFTHYDDGLEHSIWLGMMRDRLELLRILLSNDGSLWVTLDDNEVHYFKVMADEIFGRSNFVADVAWQKVYTTKNSAKHFSEMHDHLLVYAKQKDVWSMNLLPRSDKQDSAYLNPDSDPRGPWKSTPLHARNYYSAGSYEVLSPTGRTFSPPPGRYWAVSRESFDELNNDARIWWGRDGDGTPNRKTFLSEVRQGVSPSTMWFFGDAGHNAEAKNEINALKLSEDVFITPKPEKLVKLILTIGSNAGDWVLDSFAGSGTTGAVAHKMGRRWIMVELGEQCHTLIQPRLKKVIDGEDPGGITKAVVWKGGGGFRYFKLAPSLLKQDKWARWVVNDSYNAEMLAEALCKLEGFRYAPSESLYWQQGQSTEQDFIYVTTQTMTHEQLLDLSEEVGTDRTLLVLAMAFRGLKTESYPNLTVKKIPSQVLNRCEWGHDDYSLDVSNLPQAPKPIEAQPSFDLEVEL